VSDQRTFWDIAKVQFAKHRTAVFGLRTIIALGVLAIFAPLLATSSPLVLDRDEASFLEEFDANDDGAVTQEECPDRDLFAAIDVGGQLERTPDGREVESADGTATTDEIAHWGRLHFPWIGDLFDQNIWQSGVDLFFNLLLVFFLPAALLFYLLRRSRRAIVMWSTVVVLYCFFSIVGPDDIVESKPGAYLFFPQHVFRYSTKKVDYLKADLGVRHELVLSRERVEELEARLPEVEAALRDAEARAGKELSERERSDAEALVEAAARDVKTTSTRLELWRERLAKAEAKADKGCYMPFVVMPPVGFHHADTNNERITEEPTYSGWGTSHIAGTDTNGRDAFARLLYGARVSLTIGVIAVSIYCTIGTILGSIMGFFGGRVDMLLMRVVEIMICFPTLAFILLIVGVTETRSIFLIMVAIGIIRWTGVARLIRGQFLSERTQDYVVAAEALGVPKRRIVFKHVLPNAIHPMFVAATFGVAAAILIESSLAFLGLGDPNVPSWGQIMLKGRETMASWLILGPGLAIFLTVVSLNLVGEGLRDALDPKLRQ